MHHLRHVLRLKENDPIILFNGNGEEASGKITSLNTKEVVIQILSVRRMKNQTTSLILACAVPKRSKFELIIEKATELGVDEIIPVKTKRTELNLKADRLEKRILRFRTVAINASKQSRRLTIPVIHPLTEFPKVVEDLTKRAVVLMPSLCGPRKGILETLRNIDHSRPIAFLIGPEGDFTPEEYALAQRLKCIPVSLGTTILKVDTAAICALACASQFRADFKPTS
ncbi:MAG: hypothetical protein A2Y04_05520 [Omnitrophica WOR_2 bacterium GWC2_45_7]|nr:MAG: hypothetical protein A2Z81_08000 [Omnitrophica WOR_2 bacterium GWA2_45_18]OGX18555.1 MAG: hypothetical protein A2Y04_05520 [Omnitrophica WOR_2 bacterium GWC2_45_7]